MNCCQGVSSKAAAPARRAGAAAGPAGLAALAAGDELVGGVDHHRLAAADDRGTGEPDAGAADQAGDVRPAVEHRGEVACRVVDLDRQHRVALDRADLHYPDLALHGDLPAGDGADRGDTGYGAVAGP